MVKNIETRGKTRLFIPICFLNLAAPFIKTQKRDNTIYKGYFGLYPTDLLSSGLQFVKWNIEPLSRDLPSNTHIP